MKLECPFSCTYSQEGWVVDVKDFRLISLIRVCTKFDEGHGKLAEISTWEALFQFLECIHQM